MRRTEAKTLCVGSETFERKPDYAPAFAVMADDAEVLARWDNGDAAAAI